jgi:hypothetical protein
MLDNSFVKCLIVQRKARWLGLWLLLKIVRIERVKTAFTSISWWLNLFCKATRETLLLLPHDNDGGAKNLLPTDSCFNTQCVLAAIVQPSTS